MSLNNYICLVLIILAIFASGHSVGAAASSHSAGASGHSVGGAAYGHSVSAYGHSAGGAASQSHASTGGTDTDLCAL
jgi:hypothetical protein